MVLVVNTKTNRFSPMDTARNSATKNLCPQLPRYTLALQ